MAIIYCPECGNQVSDRAPSCPTCGFVNPGGAAGQDESWMSRWGWLLAVLALLLVGGVIGGVLFLNRDNDESTALATSSSTTSTTAPAQAATTVPAATVAPGTTVAPVTTEASTTTVPPTTTAAPTTTATPVTTTSTLPAFVTADCIDYDPAVLDVEDLGATGWRLIADASALLLYDSATDAQRGLAIAANHTELCFIGRDNTQDDRFRFIHEFWNGDSGQDVTIPGPEDCLPYDNSNLSIEDTGGNVWRLTDGSSAMALFDGEADALVGMTLAEAFNEQCFIGRGNTRSDPIRYIREYWRLAP